MQQSPRRRLRAAAAAALAALALACDGTTVGGPERDKTPPRVSVARAAGAADTVVSFTLTASDNLGLKSISVRSAGSAAGVAGFDTVFTSEVKDYQATLALPVAGNVPAGTTVRVFADVRDGAGNITRSDTLDLSVGNVAPPTAQLVDPVAGTAAVAGRSLEVVVRAAAPLGVRAAGYFVTGAFTFADSTVYSGALRDTVTARRVLDIPASASGTFTITPFVLDSLGQRITGAGVQLTIGSAPASSVPTVTFTASSRLEVSDTIRVSATDPNGITVLGYEVRDAGTLALIAADSALFPADNLTSRSRTFQLRLNITQFPRTVVVSAFAVNRNGTRAYAGAAAGTPNDPRTARADTAAVVAGVTRSLPAGGAVADAYYHPRFDALYLTNIERNTLEVFSLADSSFRAPVIVGSRPWGIAAWPRDRNGTPGDTLLIANSGGTNVSYVRLGGAAREVYRYPLPNIIVSSVTSERSSTTGEVIQVRRPYDFSDRPQFLATTCRGAATPGNPCGNVLMLYSTTPTPGQPDPFTGRGTVRYEDLSARQSHFFWEHAEGTTAGRIDTLEIARYAAEDETGAMVGSDSLLIPFEQVREVRDPTTGVLTARYAYSVTAQIARLAFRDTTFVRNSGNFARAIIGEGGPVLGSRAIMFDATRGPRMATFADGTPIPVPVADAGVSRSVDVSDFIANAFARVQGVGINFDGALSAIRGDSTYLLSPSLRLQGLLQTSASNAGIDFHPRNTGINNGDLSTRLLFAASNQPLIEIYDTYCFARIASVPVRDPIIGPIKSSIRANGEIVLVGATGRGVVIVTLPNTFRSTCQ